MNPPPSHASRAARYFGAVSCAALAALAWQVMAGPLRDETPYQVMLPFVVLAAWFGGLGPGLLVTTLATVWAVSRVSGGLAALDQELELALFFPIGAFIATLCGSLRGARETAELARQNAELARQSADMARQSAETTAAQLSISQARYQTIVETASEGIWTTDRALNTTFVNARMAQMLGTTPAAMMGRPVSEWQFDQDRHKPFDNLAAHAAQGYYQVEGRYRRVDGSELWCLVNVSMNLAQPGDADTGTGTGMGRVLALHTDITAARGQAEQLRRSHERFERATRAVSGFISEWSVPDGTLWRSEGFSDLLGHDLAKIPDSHAWWLAQIHPADVGRAEAELQAALARGDQISREFRVRHADGSYVWLWERSLAVRDEAGEPGCIVASVSDISARKKAEEALQNSEADFRRLADSMPQIVWSCDAGGTPNYFNRRWYGLAGQSEEPDTIKGWDDWDDCCHPEDLQRARKLWRECLLSGESCRFEARLRDKTGTVRWFLCRIVPVREAASGQIMRWFGTATDIDESRRVLESQQFLAEVSAIFASSLDYEETLEQVAKWAVPTLGDWCFVVLKNAQGAPEMQVAAHSDPQKVERFWERQRRFGLDPAAPRGFSAVIRSGQPELVETMNSQVRSGVIAGEYQTGVDEAGHRSTLIVPLETGGAILGCLGFSFAESDRTFTQNDVPLAQEIARRAASAIQNARLYRELQNADRRKDEFLAMLAHELRNPLAAISGARALLDMLLEGQAKLDTATPRAILERQIAQLSRLVDDLLDVSRITRGKIELRRRDCDFVEIVKTALDGVRPLVLSRRHELRLELPDQPIPLHADPARLGQIVSNLITNAAKYTDPGGQITVSLGQETSEAGAQGILRVRDNGTGIKAEVLPSLWELFVQSDRTLDRAQGGLGIGLTLVKSLAELHGGRVEATSQGLGKGSEFLVALPLAPLLAPFEAPFQGVMQAPASRPESAPESADLGLDSANFNRPASLQGAAPPPLTRGTSPRVLIVDDNHDAAWMLSKYLEQKGYDVQVAFDGAQGLVLACGWQPDVALLDIGMPEMNGYEVARHLRSLPEGRAMRLIALTGYGQASDRQHALEAGFDAHLTKPVAMEELESELSMKK